MVERIAELVREKRIEGIADLRDESDRDGMRVVIETEARRLGRGGAEPALPLHAAADLLRGEHAGARTAAGREQMDLRDLLVAFLDFREEVVVRRSKFELEQGPGPRPPAGRPAPSPSPISTRSSTSSASLQGPGRGAQRLVAQGLAGGRHDGRWWS